MGSCGGTGANSADATTDRCGNGTLDPGESCDTGIASGMPGACPVACDDGNPCTADHLAGAGCLAECAHDPIVNCCGNGQVEAGESCDDGGQADYDGCSGTCQLERALVIRSFTIAAGDQGCDLDGNGSIDNAVGTALNAQVRAYLSQAITGDLGTQARVVSLLEFDGADPTFASPSLIHALVGVDLESPPVPGDYFSGSELFHITRDQLDSNGRPIWTLNGSAPGGNLSATALSFGLIVPYNGVSTGFFINEVSTPRLSGTLTLGLDGPSALTFRICGGWTARSLLNLPNQSGLGTSSTLLDVLVVGLDAFGYHVTPTQPDLDVDGDGLERLLDTDGDSNIDLCIDGSGTQILGHDCARDPRIADAYSQAIDCDAVRGVLAGLR